MSKIEACMRTKILPWVRGARPGPVLRLVPRSPALHSVSPHLQIPAPAHSLQSIGNMFPAHNFLLNLLIFRQRDSWTINHACLSIKEILEVFNFHIIFLFLCKHAGGLFTITPRNIGDIIMEHCTFSDPRIRMQLLTRKEGAVGENVYSPAMGQACVCQQIKRCKYNQFSN